MAEQLQFRILTEEEEAELTRKGSGPSRDEIYEPYREALMQLPVGRIMEIPLRGEKKVTVKNRLKHASEDVGKPIEFLRTDDTLVRIRAVEQQAIPKPRGGRPRKQ